MANLTAANITKKCKNCNTGRIEKRDGYGIHWFECSLCSNRSKNYHSPEFRNLMYKKV